MVLVKESLELSVRELRLSPIRSLGRLRRAQEQPVLGQQASADFGFTARPWLTVGVQMAADVIILVSVIVLAVVGRYMFRHDFDPAQYWSLWPLLTFFLFLYAIKGMYSGTFLSPGVALPPVEELRRASLATTGVFLGFALVIFLTRGGMIYSRSLLLIAWILALVLIPLGRACVRHWFGRSRWWGSPVLVLGAGETGRLLVQTLQTHPWLGLRPVAFFDEDLRKRGQLCGLPVMGGFDLLPEFVRRWRVSSAVVAMPGVSSHRLRQLNEQYGALFSHLMIVPPLAGYTSFGVEAKDLGGMVGLEIRHRLLLRSCRVAKRTLDLVLAVLGVFVSLPLVAVIALLIKLTSRGPVFYRQERIGLGGRRFQVWKFRTMIQGADDALAYYCDLNPELREQWARDHKLQDDPRVTPVGRWLRRSSLDELPQLWNILKGEMSLVGPRPIVAAEIPRYGDAFDLYCRVLPGLTGWWQVSGRNETTYQERVELDAFYVYNWSIWLDLYILARTIAVILHGRGAC